MVLNYLLKIKGRAIKSPSKGTVPNEPSHLLGDVEQAWVYV